MTSKRRARKALTTGTPAVFGWYAAFVLPETTLGSDTPALVPRDPAGRAFWASWWTEDPRRTLGADPDEYGFVEGTRALSEAIGAAYDALRRGRGPKVYDISIGADFALAAFREGAPRRRSVETDFDALAREGFAELGLPTCATPDALRKAFKARHPDNGGDPAENMDRLTRLFKAALAHAKRTEEEQARVAVLAGTIPARRRRRPKGSLDTGTLLAGGPREFDRPALIAEVKRIATRVRARAERAAAVIHVPADLAGLCMVAALGLVEALKVQGIGARIAGGTCCHRGHYWAEVPLPADPHLVDPGCLIADITATQFGSRWPKVVVLPPERKTRASYMRQAGGAMVRDFVRTISAEKLAAIPARWWADDGPMAAPAQPMAEVG